MSMSIHHGWKFPDGATLDQVFAASRSQQLLLRAVADGILAREMTRNAVEKMDHCFGAAMGWIKQERGIADQSSPIGEAFMDIVKRRELVSVKGVRARDVDVSASLVVIPYETGLYALSYCENEHMLDAMTTGLGMSSFHWVDDDPPEGMTLKQWYARRDLWDAMLGDAGVPSLAGVTIELVSQNHLTPEPDRTRPLDLSGTPSIKRRAWNIALDAPQSGLHEIKGMGATHHALMELRENPPEAFASLCAEIESVLPDPIPQEWLFMKQPELTAAWQAVALSAKSASTGHGRPGSRL